MTTNKKLIYINTPPLKNVSKLETDKDGNALVFWTILVQLQRKTKRELGLEWTNDDGTTSTVTKLTMRLTGNQHVDLSFAFDIAKESGKRLAIFADEIGMGEITQNEWVDSEGQLRNDTQCRIWPEGEFETVEIQSGLNISDELQAKIELAKKRALRDPR